MTATDTLTAATLYEIDPTFRALVDVWVTERRCPLVLVDRCLDFGLGAAADCARWAATERERANIYGNGCLAPYPLMLNHVSETREFYWHTGGEDQYHHDATEKAPYMKPGVHRDTVESAILWLLDNWQPAAQS